MVINVFDLMFLGVILAFSAWSAVNGWARELVSLLGLLGGIVAAGRLSGPLGEALEPVLVVPGLAETAAAAGLIAGGLLGGALLGGFMSPAGRVRPGAVGRLFSAAVGATKGLVVTLTIYWLVDRYLPMLQDELGSSWSSAYLSGLLGQLNRIPLI